MRFLPLALLLTPLQAEVIHFDKEQTGKLPAGWTQAMTHAGGAPKWEVLRDATAPSKPNVLAQTSADKTGGRFPLAIHEKARIKNGEVKVRCRPVSGAVDQACGIVWRYQDPDNYYVARANALENNVVLYKVERGARLSLAPKGAPPKTYGVKHPVATNQWHELRVTFQDSLFTLYFDGARLFEVEDSTFTAPGNTGLWTKADSVTYFDDFEVTGH